MKAASTKQMRSPSAMMIATEGGNRFEFALERDPEQTYVLPLIQDLPVKQVRKLSHATDDDGAGVDVVFDVLDDLIPDFMDIATQREVSLVMEAWSEASQVTPGE